MFEGIDLFPDRSPSRIIQPDLPSNKTSSVETTRAFQLVDPLNTSNGVRGSVGAVVTYM